MVIEQLAKLSDLQQQLVITSTSLYLQGNLRHSLFLEVITEVSLNSGVEVNCKELTSFLLKHVSRSDNLNTQLSLSLICPASLKDLIIKELTTLNVCLPPRGCLLESEFIVGMGTKSGPFIKMDITFSDGRGGVEQKDFNMSLQTFNRLEQSSNEIKSLCGQ